MISVDIEQELFGQEQKMLLKAKFSLQEKSFTALFGPSGAGKTSLLRIIAGLQKSKGKIKVGSELWQDEKHFTPPQKRSIGFVFQDYALFPHLSVIKNLLFVQNNKDLAMELLEMIGMQNMQNANVKTLSGGQKQRVALSRAMMRKPKLLLLDEPFGALDPHLRQKLCLDLLGLHKRFETTSILVSHEPSEIYKLADNMIVLENGTIEQIGKPSQILLKTKGSQKFSFEGELLEKKNINSIYVLVFAIGRQIVEIVCSVDEAKDLKIGHRYRLSTKAFAPSVS